MEASGESNVEFIANELAHKKKKTSEFEQPTER